MKNNKKKKSFNHLSIDDRILIEEELNQGSNFSQIGNLINKHPSSISKEIKRNFTTINPSSFNNSFNKCYKKRTCQLKNICQKNCDNLCKNCKSCNNLCPDFKQDEICDRLLKPPYVCNGCLKRNGCRKDKFVYKSKEADIIYRELLISSRQGINHSEQQLKEIAKTVVPLVKKVIQWLQF